MIYFIKKCYSLYAANCGMFSLEIHWYIMFYSNCRQLLGELNEMGTHIKPDENDESLASSSIQRKGLLSSRSVKAF